MRLTSKRFQALGVAAVLGTATTLGLGGCGGGESPSADAAGATGSGLEPQAVADMLHAVMAADRKVYVANVVNRLTKVQDVQIRDPETGEMKKLKGSEEWDQTFGTLPLPAQQFRYGSEEAFKKNNNFEYGLISSWSINKKHMPKSDFEKEKIKAMEETGKPQYGTEEVGGETFFVAMYPDRATAKACWDCHNKHKDSPKTDFKQDDVMGGIVIRIPV
ncbi:MAG: DUF3365 domain-containing protein [Planctomycetota bacterium]